MVLASVRVICAAGLLVLGSQRIGCSLLSFLTEDDVSQSEEMKPRLQFAASPTSGKAPLTVVYTFSAMCNSAGNISAMYLDPGNGSWINVTGLSTYSFTYNNSLWWKDNDVTARFKAEDDSGFSNTTSINISVEPDPTAPVWHNPFCDSCSNPTPVPAPYTPDPYSQQPELSP